MICIFSQTKCVPKRSTMISILNVQYTDAEYILYSTCNNTDLIIEFINKKKVVTIISSRFSEVTTITITCGKSLIKFLWICVY